MLHQGRIAEMKTGEGKTQTVILPAYLNALAGQGVHVVTVNDYLARRDSEWMGKVYRYLGLSVGLIVHDMDNNARKAAYQADITYGTNNELGFDYLRDNMVIYKENRVQRGHHFAIVDEVDSILIDEARTPLIISGQGDQSTELYQLADRCAKGLRMVKVAELDEKQTTTRSIPTPTTSWTRRPRRPRSPRTACTRWKHSSTWKTSPTRKTSPSSTTSTRAIKARGVMTRDIDYVVKDGEVIIVDEFTGRLMYGRRYNEGLHQAIEAKEA